MRAVLTGILIATMTLPVAAQAQSAAEKVIAARKAKFKDMGAAFKALNDQARRPSISIAVIQAAAVRLQRHAEDMTKNNWFPKGSGPEAGVKTDAKPEIWTSTADFNRARNAFRASAIKLSAAARGSDIAPIKLAIKEMGASCGGCHKPFRAED